MVRTYFTTKFIFRVQLGSEGYNSSTFFVLLFLKSIIIIYLNAIEYFYINNYLSNVSNED